MRLNHWSRRVCVNSSLSSAALSCKLSSVPSRSCSRTSALYEWQVLNVSAEQKPAGSWTGNKCSQSQRCSPQETAALLSVTLNTTGAGWSKFAFWNDPFLGLHNDWMIMTSEFGSLTSKQVFCGLTVQCQFTPMLLGEFFLMSVLYCKQKSTREQPVQDMFTQTSGRWGSHQILGLWETWACVIQRICNYMDTESIWRRKEQLLSTVSLTVGLTAGLLAFPCAAELQIWFLYVFLFSDFILLYILSCPCYCQVTPCFIF